MLTTIQELDHHALLLASFLLSDNPSRKTKTNRTKGKEMVGKNKINSPLDKNK